jgi:DNA-binding NtrC family response regulator
MNVVPAVDPVDVEVASHEARFRKQRPRAPLSRRPFVPETSAALLHTIASVLDIRTVLPRISDIVKLVVPHDSLVLRCSDREGRVTLEACSTRDLPEQGWTAGPEDKEFTIVNDLRCARPRSTDGDARVAAGYRSLLSVQVGVQDRIMQLGFLAKQANAYLPDDVASALHVAHYMAVSVAHEQLAAVERSRAEARGRSERVAARVRAVTQSGEQIPAHRRLVGRSEEWQRVVARALRVASTDTTVLLHGEPGTGKEVIARFIHQASQRKTGPFVAINCAALPQQLLELELFGYERGAFPGPVQPKAGRIELAAGGTLFLDDVSEMSLVAQARLLRLLKEREFQRLGGGRIQKADVHVIAATNRNLCQAVEHGSFREDLLYLLWVFDIQVPPLRDRTDDVLLLAEFFLQVFADESGCAPARLSDEARDALVAHSWPGNTRELRNVLEAAAILTEDGVIERRHLSLQAPMVVSRGTENLAIIERQTIEQTLEQTDWNKSKTARRLGLTRMQLYIRLRRYGLDSCRNQGARE